MNIPQIIEGLYQKQGHKYPWLKKNPCTLLFLLYIFCFSSLSSRRYCMPIGIWLISATSTLLRLCVDVGRLVLVCSTHYNSQPRKLLKHLFCTDVASKGSFEPLKCWNRVEQREYWNRGEAVFMCYMIQHFVLVRWARVASCFTAELLLHLNVPTLQ